MHWQAFQFVASIKALFPEYFFGKSVLEIGSHQVNGSIRELFSTDDYTGLDLSSGSGVDVVISGHEFRSSKQFDVLISCECFEHNPYYLQTFENMIEHLSDDGLLIFTCATTGRPEHGTSRTDPSMSPGTSSLSWDYYKNLTQDDFIKSCSKLNGYVFFTNDVSQDLYFVGAKSNLSGERLRQCLPELRRLIQIYRELSSTGGKVYRYFPAISSHLFCPSFIFYLYHQLRGQGIEQNRFFGKAVQRAKLFWPASPEVTFVLGAIAENENNGSLDYLVLYKNAFQLSDGKAFFANGYAEALSRVGYLADAIIVLKQIVNYSSNPDLLWKLADYALKTNMLSESLEYINNALQSEALNPVYLNTKLSVLQTMQTKDVHVRELAEKILNESQPPAWIAQRCNKILQSMGE